MEITKILFDKYSSDDEKFVYASKIFFFVTVFITSCIFQSSWRPGFLLNSKYQILKLILCFILPSIATIFCFYATKNLEYVGKATSLIMILFIATYFIDLATLKVVNCARLYHFACALISFCSIFATSCLCLVFSKYKYCGFFRFYNSFFNGYLFLFLFLFFFAFFSNRQVMESAIINLVPFNGEIKDTFNALTNNSELSNNKLLCILQILRTFGNICFFTTMPLLLSKFIKKHKYFFMVATPIFISVSAEVIQGLTQMGDADIDDIILNTFGTIIGVLIYKFIIEKLLLEEEKCLVL